jgi:hypothetical protein
MSKTFLDRQAEPIDEGRGIVGGLGTDPSDGRAARAALSRIEDGAEGTVGPGGQVDASAVQNPGLAIENDGTGIGARVAIAGPVQAADEEELLAVRVKLVVGYQLSAAHLGMR